METGTARRKIRVFRSEVKKVSSLKTLTKLSNQIKLTGAWLRKSRSVNITIKEIKAGTRKNIMIPIIFGAINRYPANCCFFDQLIFIRFYTYFPGAFKILRIAEIS
jgi:hypothetical protein